MKIHEDGIVAAATPSRKTVSFGGLTASRNSGRTPLRDHNRRIPIKSPYPDGGFGPKSTTFQSPSSASKRVVTSNSFRQDLKKGCTPVSTKQKKGLMGERDKENNLSKHVAPPTDVGSKTNQPQERRLFHPNHTTKTPSSASALRRTLRSTIQPGENQHRLQEHSETVTQQKRITFRTSSNAVSSKGPFQSVTTAMTSSLVGRSRLLGKGGVAPGKTALGGLGPPARVAPRTPNTLLRTELEDDEFDESMLLSPPPGALWDTLNLSSAGGDNRRHIVSPTVTTGLIVVSPQAAEQIHTWSSTKKRLSSPDPSPGDGGDKLSPNLPRALMHTPHEAKAATDSPTIAATATVPSTDKITTENSPNILATKNKYEDKLENATENIEKSTNKENSPFAADGQLFAADVQSRTSSASDSLVASRKNEPHLKSIKKSTKGGIAMDLTELFSPEGDKSQPSQQGQQQPKKKKQWAESTPLSSSMPASLLARLNSKRETTSKHAKNNVNQIQSVAPVSQLSRTKPNLRKTKSPTVGGSSTRRRTVVSESKPLTSPILSNKLARDPSGRKMATTRGLHKPRKSEATSNVSTASSNASTDTFQKDATKSQNIPNGNNTTSCGRNVAGKKHSQVAMNIVSTKSTMSSLGVRKGTATDAVKPWNRSQKEKKENSQSRLTQKVMAREDSNVGGKTSHRGGLAFDVGFNDEGKSKTPLREFNCRSGTTLSVSKTTIITKETKPSGCWAERQCDVFTGWLNYTLNPEEMDINNEGCIASGLRALIIHRRLAEGRVNAMNLFQGHSMREIRMIILKEIARGKLSIRSDRDVTVDVQLRKKLVSLLLSYTTPWLRLALEVMFGECIEPLPFSESCPKSYLGRMRSALELFIKKRFLCDENTLQKFTKGRCNVPSGKFETRYKREMRSLVLSRIMTLVFFLDRAKEANALENVPRLFTVSSNVKSTRDVLITICRECLSAEGDIVKHLSRIGLKISYVQDPVDEINFRVTNLATDLRDGVILTRLAEIVTGASFKSYMSSLRLPVVSRLQKKFNVNLAFSSIKDFGIIIAEGISAHHILDGHKEMVLALMWCIIAHCCIEKLLKGDQLEQEIQNVIQSSQAREKVEGRVYSKIQRKAPNSSSSSPMGSGSTPERVLKDLLLRWSQAVCSSFGVVIDDLSNSFADGKALCLLIHYYHPSLIRIDEIIQNSPGYGLNLSVEEVLQKEHRNWRRASISMQELGGIPDMLPVCDSNNPPNEKSMLLCLSYLCSRLMESSQEIFATILIQSCYRKYSRKVLMEKKIEAASTIFRIWTDYKENYFRKQEQRYKVAVATLEDFVLSHKNALMQLKKSRLKREGMIRSVTDIQRIYRGHLGRARFDRARELKLAATLVQKAFRRFLAIRIYTDFKNKRKSAIAIQSTFRRFAAREYFLNHCFYIIELQRYFRGHLVRNDLRAREHAARVIQQAWRYHMDNVVLDLSAILIQKVWRGVLGRRKCCECLTRRDAACAIQRVWRGYYQSLVYFITIESSILLQKTVRGFLVRKAVPINQYRDAAISIQRVWRGFSVEVEYQLELFDIICVQSLARRFLSQREYTKKINAVSVIQCAGRCFIARLRIYARIEDRQASILRYKSAVVIQAHVRKLIARQNMRFLQYSAAVIQKQWRTHLWYRLSKHSSTKIQSTYRAWKCQRHFLLTRKAAIDIQRNWRGFVSRQNDEVLSFAAILIQSAWRRYWIYSDYTMYMKETKSATLIQSHVRRMATRRIIEEKNVMARTIQNQWQRYKQFKFQTDQAIKIQAAMRSKLCTTRFLKARKAALVIQQMARARQARQVLNVKQNERKCECAAVLIQSLWRGFSKQVQFELDVLDIICVQSMCRRYLACRVYRKTLSAASIIQRAFRCSTARRERVMRKLVLDTMVMESSTKIQTVLRGHIARSKYLGLKMASLNIQKFWRGQISRQRLRTQYEKSVAIQSTWRMYQHRMRYLLHLDSVTAIQTCFRAHSMRSQYLVVKNSVICIQRCWRGKATRDHLSKLSDAASVLQRAFRCSTARRERVMRKLVLDTMVMESSTKIQTVLRGHIARSKYLGLKMASLNIQKFWRGYSARQTLQRLSKKSVAIQSTWRMYQHRMRYLLHLDSVTAIQTCFRAHSIRSQYLVVKNSVICIQRCWRGKATRDHLSKLSHAATMIQSHWRRTFAQNNYLLDLLEIKSATLIQASFRMYCRRLDYMVVKYSAHTIQRYTRGHLSRVDLAVKHFAASEIQRVWRGYCTYPLKTIIGSLIKIQSMVRKVSAKRKVDEVRLLYWVEVCNRNRNATIIQSAYRKHVERRKRENAARVIQNAHRFYSHLKRIQAASRGIIKLQSTFRGLQVRKTRSKRLTELARQIEVETRRAILDPTMRLGYRTSRALEILQTSQSLTKIMDAVRELEASTRLSVVCCQVFTKVNAANILLHLIQSCNRSVPHMELKEHILLTLENVAQYPPLVGSFAHQKYAEVFLDNVQVFRDKDGIFCLAVVLLDLISNANQDVAQFCATHEHLKRLKEVYRVVSRRRTKSHKNRALSAKARRLRKYGLAKRDDFDREIATKKLGDMIEAFSEIEVPRITTPTHATHGKVFSFD